MLTNLELCDRLAAMAHPEGGWGYRADQAAHLEPTCMALVALASDPTRYAAAISAGVRVVRSHLQPDGSYRLNRGRPQAVWTTSLAIFALSKLPSLQVSLEATTERLLTIEARVLKSDPEVAGMVDIDVRLMGWPWSEDTFSWVEPTSWACIALRSVGRGDHPRVQEGLKLLLDRAFETGGANYGNRTVLGRATEPIPGPTAVMLLALQGVQDDPRIEAAKGYLRLQAEQSTDLDHLSWSMLALQAHATDDATRQTLRNLIPRIGSAYATESNASSGLSAGPQRIALAALALSCSERHPFQFGEGAVQIASAPAYAERAQQPVSKSEAKSVTERFGKFFRNVMVKGLGAMRNLPAQSGVHIGRCADYDERMLELLKIQYSCFRGAAPAAGKRIVLKPNLVEYHKDKVINTDPRFISAVIQLFKDEGAAEIIVAEGPGHWRNVQFLVNESGLGDVLRDHDVRFVDINHDEPVKMLNLGRTTGLEFLYLSRTVLSADLFVSLPKLKTHHWAGATLSLKNLFGTLPGICYGWPKNELHWRGIPNSIVDIAMTHTPHLAIVDGIVGMEGDGPLNGTAKPFGAIIMGTDLVAVDATCCRLMELPPERVPTLALATSKKLGHLAEAKIAQLGESIDALKTPFVRPPGIESQLIPEAVAK